MKRTRGFFSWLRFDPDGTESANHFYRIGRMIEKTSGALRRIPLMPLIEGHQSLNWLHHFYCVLRE